VKVILLFEFVLGFPITAIREIKLLKMMSHKNIIRLREIIVSKASVRNNFRG
jgi:cyclin-dependent kinase 12/13